MGVAVFAVSGALAAMQAGLDLFGLLVLAAMTAVGGGTLRVIGRLYVDGDIEVTGDVVASGISLVHHTHGGVQQGGANTKEPNR
jgi:phage baseplate assembly protein gpV